MRNRTILTGLIVSLVAVLLLSVTATAEAGGRKPVLQVNSGLTIPRGSGPVFLSTAHLFSTDLDDDDSTIYYRVISVSDMDGAMLTINGVTAIAGSTFAQSALVAGNTVAVRHNGVLQSSARFTFAVTDDEGNQALTANNRTPATFTITITEPINVAPTLSWIKPDGVADVVNPGEPYAMKWIDEDPDDNAVIDFYFADGVTSTYIGSAYEDPDGIDDERVWDTTGIAEGIYYLCARLTDSVGPTGSVDVWSAFPVTIGTSVNDGWQPECPTNTTEDLREMGSRALAMDGNGCALMVHNYSGCLYNIFDGSSWGPEASVPNTAALNLSTPLLKSDGAGDYFLAFPDISSLPYEVYGKFFRAGSGWETATSALSSTHPVNITHAGVSPDAAISVDGSAMVVWGYFKKPTKTTPFTYEIYANRYDGAVWGSETRLAEGLLPRVAADDHGNFMLVYLGVNANEGKIFCKLYARDSGWGAATQLKATADFPAPYTGYMGLCVDGAGFKQFVVVYATQVGGTDIDYSGVVTARVYGRAYNESAWGEERRLDNGSDRTLRHGLNFKMSLDGTALVTFEQLDSEGIEEVWANRYDGSDWSTGSPTPISFPHDATYGAATFMTGFSGRSGAVTIDYLGNGVAAFRQSIDGTVETVVVHYQTGMGWLYPSLISAADNGEEENNYWIAGEDSGRAIVVWKQNTSETWKSRYYVPPYSE